MKIDHPEVALADEARDGVTEEVKQGFLDWLCSFYVTGDDGEVYSCGGTILSLAQEKLDIINFGVVKGRGRAIQLPNSIYKIGKYPGAVFEVMKRQPKGTLRIDKQTDRVIVTCGKEITIECMADHSWHIQCSLPEKNYQSDIWHRPQGYPLWYGREKPSYLTQHSVTYGYNWAGAVDGWFILDGKKINVRGFGIRERYVAVDSSAAEIGGWEDWGWFAFHELHSSFYEMRLGMKDLSVFDCATERHYPEGKLSITHEDWAFLRELDGFIPSVYHVKIEVEDGVLEIRAEVCNATTWGVTHKVPDYPVATLFFDQAEGIFTDRSGNVRTLTGGKGTISIRQWHAYPNILPRELYSDDRMEGEKFDTL